MTFETRMTRQFMPTATILEGGVPALGSSSVCLIPPDPPGDWRFREMQMIPAFQAESSRYVGPDTALSPARFQPTEVLVIWEKYKEDA